MCITVFYSVDNLKLYFLINSEFSFRLVECDGLMAQSGQEKGIDVMEIRVFSYVLLLFPW